MNNKKQKKDNKKRNIKRVRIGSGMGMICSDETSSINFYCLAEQPFLLNQDVRNEFGIVEYFRYKDDLLVFTSADQQTQDRFMHALGEVSKHFKLKLEKACKYSVEMLDCKLSKGGEYTGGQWWLTGLLDVGIHVKQTSQKVPLCSSSMHHPSLHSAWPEGRLSHYKAICSSKKPYKHACTSFVDSMRYMLPYHPWLQSFEHNISRPPKRAAGGTWLIIPYHMCLSACGFQRVIRELCQFLPAAFHASLPRISWSRLRSNISEHTSQHFYSVVGA